MANERDRTDPVSDCFRQSAVYVEKRDQAFPRVLPGNQADARIDAGSSRCRKDALFDSRMNQSQRYVSSARIPAEPFIYETRVENEPDPARTERAFAQPFVYFEEYAVQKHPVVEDSIVIRLHETPLSFGLQPSGEQGEQRIAIDGRPIRITAVGITNCPPKVNQFADFA